MSAAAHAVGAVAHAVGDWGTSSFRLWALDRDGRVLGERRSSQGLVAAAAEGFEAVLESHLAALGLGPEVPVMLCGMIGARGGWTEAAYLDAPLRLDRLGERALAVPGTRRPVRILPGVAQRDALHPDVMRGEETQLLALARDGHSGLVCLPGTHSKWVRLEGGTLARFTTFMTGELFQAIRDGSVVGQALRGAAAVAAESPAFAEGVAAALAEPAAASNLVFELRAGWLLGVTPADAALARLSGLLIGLELSGAAGRLGPLDGVALVAAGATAPLYARALAVAGVAGVTTRDAEACVRDGLHAAAVAAFLQPQGAPA